MAIRRDDNKYTRLSLQEYNGQARNGEIVIDLDTYNVYVGDASGTLLPISSGGGNLANAIIGNLTVTGTSNLGQVGNITILGGNPGEVLTTDGSGHLSWAPAGSGGYGNSNVSVYLAGNIPTDIIPLANAVQILGNVNNQWKELWVDDVYINSIPLTTTGSQLTFNGVPVLTASGTEDIITSGNGQFDRVTATFGTFGQITGDGSGITNIALANYANYAGNVVISNQPNITTVGTLTNLAVAGNAQVGGNVAVTGNFAVGTSLNYDTATNTLSIAGTANVNQLDTESVTGLSPAITATGVNGGISLQTNGTGNVNVNGAIISSVATPVNPNDAANKAYVDAIASGLSIKPSVQLATNAPLPTYAYNNGAGGIGATISIIMPNSDPLLIEGQPALAGYRVLIKDEVGANQAYNGIYLVSYSPLGVEPPTTTLTRTTDFDESDEIPSAFVFDEYSGNGWVCTNVEPPPATIGTTPITWTQFSRAGQYSPGIALSQVGTDFNVNTDGVTVAVNASNELEVPPNAQFVTPNIGSATGSNLTVTGNVGAANITATGLLTASESNLGPIGNVTVLGGTNGQVITTDGTGNLSFVTIPAGYGNSNVSVYLDGNIPTNIVPLANAAQNLGSAANQWNNMWVGGTGHFVNLNAGNITITNSISGNGRGLSNIAGANIVGAVANANYAAYAGNVVNANQPNITTVGTLTGLTVGGTANVNQLDTDSIQGLSPVITATGVNGGISLQTNGTGNVDVNSTNIVNVLDPVNPQDAATKAYVDAVASGLEIKNAVQLASNAPLPSYFYSNGAAGVGATINITMPDANPLLIEGQPALAGYRVLIKDEVGANQAYNGIYVVSYSSSSISAGGITITTYLATLTRATDCNQPDEFYSAFVFDQYSGNGWVCTNLSTSPITVGTTPITWTQFSQAGQYFAGSGIALAGSTFNALVDGTTVAINGTNELSIPPNAQLTTPNIGSATGSNLTLTGNIAAANISSANVTTGNATVTGLLTASESNLGPVGNITILGGSTGQVLTTDGTGNLSWETSSGNANLTVIPAVYFVAPTTGNNQAFSNIYLGSYVDTEDLTVFYNGVLLEPDFYSLTGSTLTITTSLQTGDTIDVIRQFANATTIVPVLSAIPSVYFTAPITGNNQTFTNSILSLYQATSDLTVFYNGVLLEDSYYSLSGSTLTVNTVLQTGDSIDITRQLVSNVTLPVYGAVPAIYFTAPATGNNQTFSNVFLSSYENASDMTVFYNGALLEDGFYTLLDDTLTVNTELNIGDSIDIIRQLAGNIINVGGGYGDSNVLTYLSSGTFAGDFVPAGNSVYSLGSITNQWRDLWVSNSTIYISGVPIGISTGNVLTVGNANVVTTSPDGTTATTGVLTVDGNIVANTGYYFIGDGGLLSNISGGGGDYSNANVAAFLPTYTGDIGGNNLTLTGNVVGFDLTATGRTSLGPINNVTILGGSPGQSLTTTGTGVLSWATPAGTYTNSNVATYLPTNTSNIRAGNLTVTGTAFANTVSLGLGNLRFTANTISTTSDTITIDPLGDGTNAGNVVIAGNMTVGGTLTYNNTVSATTEDLQWIAANNAASRALATGAGLAVGPTGSYAQFIYNAGSNAWQSSLPIIASDGVDANGPLTATLGVFSSNVVAAYFEGNGSQLTGMYANANVAAYLPTYLPTYTGNLGVDNIVATGNVTAQYYIGNGSLLTGLPASYSNANVESYLPTYTGELPALTGNVTTTANIEAAFFIGDGSQLTGLPAGYTNSDVAAYLASDTLMTNIITSANISSTNLAVSGNTTSANTSTANLTVTGQTRLADVSSVRILGGSTGEVLITDGNGNLSWSPNPIYTVPPVYITAVSAGNNQQFSNTILASYNSNTEMTVFYNGSLLENTYYTLAGDVITVNIPLEVGDGIDVVTTIAASVNSIVSSGYGNSNVAAYLPLYTGALSNLAGAVTTTSTITGATISAGAGNLELSENILSSTADLITIDPLGDGSPAGNVVIAGNLQVTGNLTYNDVVNATTNDLQWVAANNATSQSLATGAGLAVGPDGTYAQFTYNSGANSWQSSLPVIATGNVTASYFIGNGSQLTGLPETYTDANVATYLASNTNVVVNTTGNITTTANIAGGNITATGNVNAGNLVATGNVVATNIGNVAAINLTGNSAVFLSGFGTWETASSTLFRDITKLHQGAGYNAILLVADGRLFCMKGFGNGGAWYAALQKNQNTPTMRGINNCYEITFPDETVGTIVDAGSYGISAYALFDNGNLYTWGYNAYGQLGLGNTTNTFLPTLSNTNVNRVFTHPSQDALVEHQRLVIEKTNGTFWGCGHDGQYQLGLGTNTSKTSWVQLTWITTGSTVFNLGGDLGCLVVQQGNDNSIWVAGWNGTGALGIGSTTQPTVATAAPFWQIGDLTMTIQSAHLGQPYNDGARSNYQNLALHMYNGAQSRLVAAGSNNWGSLGRGNFTNSLVPVAPLESTGMTNTAIERVISAGSAPMTMYVLMTNKDLYSYGYNTYGQCGNGGTSSVSTPFKMTTNVIDMMGDIQGFNSNGYYSQSPLILKSTGWFSCGFGAYAQIGDGNADTNNTTLKRLLVPKDTNFKFVGSYGYNEGQTRIAITTDNIVWAWGYNGQSCIDPNETGWSFPVPVSFTPNALKSN